MEILITPNTQYPCDKYDLQLHKITLCTLEQNIHVTNASAKLVKFECARQKCGYSAKGEVRKHKA